MSILRIYDPPECDAGGVPLDWERCRVCEGRGVVVFAGGHERADSQRDRPCDICDGHGSLKAAALTHLTADLTDSVPIESLRVGDTIEVWVQHFGEYERRKVLARDGHEVTLGEGSRQYVWVTADETTARKCRTIIRCEDCGHPMSEGTWEANVSGRGWQLWTGPTDNFDPEVSAARRWVLTDPSFEYEPHPFPAPVHYSPCDEGCDHGGPRRTRSDAGPWREWAPQAYRDGLVEASWRQVDVRTLGWPHDLRPEKLAVLCLRCWAARR